MFEESDGISVLKEGECILSIGDTYDNKIIKDIQIYDEKELYNIIEKNSDEDDWSWGYTDKCTQCGKILFSSSKDVMHLGIPGELLCGVCLSKWRKSNLKCDVYSHNWGIIVPAKTGIWYEQQTCGVCCNHVKIQGSFIPLHTPHYFKIGNYKSMLEDLSEANYKGHNTDKVWKKIDEQMHWKYEIIEAPEGQPHNQEGILWVKFTNFSIPKDKNGKEDPRYDSWSEMGEFLLGKTVCLIYPNCD